MSSRTAWLAPGPVRPDPDRGGPVGSGPVRSGLVWPDRERIPVRDRSGTGDRPAGEIVVAGAHGGAGTTTLTALLRPAWDAGLVCSPGRDPVFGDGWPLVLVTRNAAASAARASAAIGAIVVHRGWVAVLAIVSDGYPDPPDAAYRFRILEPRVGAVVRVPFIASLRATGDPGRADLSRKAMRAIADIRAAAFASAAGPARTKTRWE